MSPRAAGLRRPVATPVIVPPGALISAKTCAELVLVINRGVRALGPGCLSPDAELEVQDILRMARAHKALPEKRKFGSTDLATEPPVADDDLTVTEAALLLEVSERRVRQLIASKALPAVKAKGEWRLDERSVRKRMGDEGDRGGARRAAS